ncbi:hypothetical protein OF83DRAFT_1167791 [Amylostereum chailletii]|nr:hypothetical protein OF83DRAFT_1167791 [Amylostereum chailletii]
MPVVPPSSSSRAAPTSTSSSNTPKNKSRPFSLRNLLHKSKPASTHSNDSNTTLIGTSPSATSKPPSRDKPTDDSIAEQPVAAATGPSSGKSNVSDTAYGKFGERHASVDGVMDGIPSRVWV